VNFYQKIKIWTKQFLPKIFLCPLQLEFCSKNLNNFRGHAKIFEKKLFWSNFYFFGQNSHFEQKIRFWNKILILDKWKGISRKIFDQNLIFREGHFWPKFEFFRKNFSSKFAKILNSSYSRALHESDRSRTILYRSCNFGFIIWCNDFGAHLRKSNRQTSIRKIRFTIWHFIFHRGKLHLFPQKGQILCCVSEVYFGCWLGPWRFDFLKIFIFWKFLFFVLFFGHFNRIHLFF